MRRLWNVAAVLFSCGLTVLATHAWATARIEESHLVTLSGNTRPEARDPANDRGIVSDGLELPHMLLLLKRPPAREAAFERMVGQLTDRASPNYNHRLSHRSDVRHSPDASQNFAIGRLYSKL